MSYKVQEYVSRSSHGSDNETLTNEVNEDRTQGDGLATTGIDDTSTDVLASEKTPLFENDVRPSKNNETAFMYVLTFFAALGGFLFGYDTGVISGALLPLTRLFQLNDLWKEVIVSSTVGAAIFGAISGGWFNDKFGRKLVLIASSVIFTAGAVIMAASSGKEVLLVGRLVVGVAIGYASTTCPLYVAECAPADIRAKLITVYQMFITIGLLFAAVVDGLFSRNREQGWRYMLGIGGVPAVFMLFGMLFMPESPRHLVQKGKTQEAKKVLIKLRGTNDVDEELKAIISTCQMNFSHGDENVFKKIAKVWMTPHTRRALIIGCVLQAIQQLCGINTVMYYSATIISLAGVEDEQTAIWYAAVVAAGNFVFTLLALLYVERMGRRKLTLASLLGVIASLCLLAATFILLKNDSPKTSFSYLGDRCSRQFSNCYDCIQDAQCGFCYENPVKDMYTNSSCLSFTNSAIRPKLCNSTILHWSEKSCPTNYAWLAVLSMILYLAAFAPGMGPMPWAINAEIYPLWARSIGTASSTSTNWFFNLIVALTFLNLITLLTRSGAFIFYACLAGIGWIFVLFLLPETKGKSLEDIEELFKGKLIVGCKGGDTEDED